MDDFPRGGTQVTGSKRKRTEEKDLFKAGNTFVCCLRLKNSYLVNHFERLIKAGSTFILCTEALKLYHS